MVPVSWPADPEISQAVAEFDGEVDKLIDAIAKSLGTSSYEQMIADFTTFFDLEFHYPRTTIAAFAAVALTRLARHKNRGGHDGVE